MVQNELFFRHDEKKVSDHVKIGMRRGCPDAPLPCPPTRPVGGYGWKAASGADFLCIRRGGSAECVCDAENKVQRLPEKLGESPHGGGEGERLQPPESLSPAFCNHLLIITVDPLGGSPLVIKVLPFPGAPLHRADETGMIVEEHPSVIASGLVAVGTFRTFSGGAGMAAGVLTTLRFAVVLSGTAQPSARGIRDTVHVVPPFQERLFGEILPAGIVSDDGDSPVPDDLRVNILLIIRGIEKMHLPGENGDRQSGEMLREDASFPDIGRTGGVSDGQFQSEFRADGRGSHMIVAEYPLLLPGILRVDMVSHAGLGVGGELRASSDRFAVGVQDETAPGDPQRGKLRPGGEHLRHLTASGEVGAVRGQRIHSEKNHPGNCGAALPLLRVPEDFLHGLGKGAGDADLLFSGQNLPGHVLPVFRGQQDFAASVTEMGASSEAGTGGGELPVSGEYLLTDKAEFTEKTDKNVHDRVNRLRSDPTAEVAQIVISRHGPADTRHLPVSAASVLLAEIPAERRIVRVVVQMGGQGQDEKTGGIVAEASLSGIERCEQRADEAEVSHGSEQHTETALRLSDPGKLRLSGNKTVMGDKPGRIFGKWCGEGFRIPAVQFPGGSHKGIQVEIRHSLLRKGNFFQTHGNVSP